MARGLITMTQGGFKAWIDELEKATEELPEIMKHALVARQNVIEDKIRENWVARGGTYGGFVYDSVGQSSAYSKINPVDVVGTVGVYDIDSVKLAHGKDEQAMESKFQEAKQKYIRRLLKYNGGKEPRKPSERKPLNAAQIAYWVEFGTSRLKAGGRKQRGTDYPDEMVIEVQPQPFISTAFFQSMSDQDAAFKREFNEQYERLVMK